MNNQEYLYHSAKTVGKGEEYNKSVVENVKSNIDLLHAALGLASESGEFADHVKECLFYGKEIDRINLKEELGDILWYAALAVRSLNSSFDEIMRMNVEKLRKRFPEGFTKEDAINRDLDKERQTLEVSSENHH